MLITSTDMRKIQFPIPPIEEQKVISKCIEKILHINHVTSLTTDNIEKVIGYYVGSFLISESQYVQ